jgi:hypothetical protein
MRTLGHIAISVDDDGALHVHTALRGLGDEHRRAVLAALAEDHGLQLMKARRPESDQFDPRFPDLEPLAKAAVSSWARWSNWLADALAKLVQPKKPPVTDPAGAAALRDVFEQHAAGVQMALTGVAPGARPEVVRVVREVEPVKVSPVEAAVRLGVARPSSGVIEPREARSFFEVQRAAEQVRLTPAETAASEAAAARAAVNLRRPVVALQVAAERALREGEAKSIRDALSRSIEQRATHEETRRAVTDAIVGTDLSNDVDRIVRTELAAAACDGAVETLLRDARALGMGDNPTIYKLASPFACSDCRRVYGPPGSPVVVKLGDVRNNSNFGRKAKDYVWTIGPLHPRCLCPPPMLYQDKLHALVTAGAARLAARYDPR